MHALKALNNCFLKLVNYLGAFAAARVNLVDPLIVNLNLEVG